jgi:predicted phosphodiesterase
MRLAVISDPHSNLAALEAVVEDVRREAPDAIVCLGDLVGYNAEPCETLGLVRQMAGFIVVGNHDRDATRAVPAAGTSSAARQAQTWTAETLTADDRLFLDTLRSILVEPGEFVAVHGCYLNDSHYSGYVTSTMLEANLQSVASRPGWPTLAFCGHTHVPLCAWTRGGRTTELTAPTLAEWPRDADAIILNPGAVGQPRDGDPRAAYALVDTRTRTARFKRVPYDIERTIDGIRRAGLPAELGERLRDGR